MGSPGAQSQAGIVSPQAGSVSIQSGRNTGNAGAKSQAGSGSLQAGSGGNQLGRSAGSTDALSQASSVSTQAGNLSLPSREGLQAAQGQTGVSVPAKALLAPKWGMPLFPDNTTGMTGEQGQRLRG